MRSNWRSALSCLLADALSRAARAAAAFTSVVPPDAGLFPSGGIPCPAPPPAALPGSSRGGDRCGLGFDTCKGAKADYCAVEKLCWGTGMNADDDDDDDGGTSLGGDDDTYPLLWLRLT